jgi:cystathionine beta-lyase/cystathionine gamma-synthase
VATSHAKLTDEQRAELGITDSLLRLSVGIEDVNDIIADIETALK